MNLEVIPSLEVISAEAWDALVPKDDPFLEHGFLRALELSGSVNQSGTGWQGRHLIVRDETGILCGALPLYEKTHSYGEYIFDFGWAHAAEQAGIAYYPKLVSAVPFTPVGGRRLLLGASRQEETMALLLEGVVEVTKRLGLSSAHLLFLTEGEQQHACAQAFHPRLSHQYHWIRDAEWTTFDAYLASMRSAVRKQIKKERQRAAQAGLTLKLKMGPELTDHEWDSLYTFYLSTVEKKGAYAYLEPAFFTCLRANQGHRVLATFAYRDGAPVAAAFFLHRGTSLYGRYWGSTEPLDAVHFELCYYLPIAWCIDNGIERFEAGAQGEHKIRRGFRPQLRYSAHYMVHPALSEAVERFLLAERRATVEQLAALETLLPFHRDAVSMP